jgi:ribosome biogenesis protein UTP30
LLIFLSKNKQKKVSTMVAKTASTRSSSRSPKKETPVGSAKKDPPKKKVQETKPVSSLKKVTPKKNVKETEKKVTPKKNVKEVKAVSAEKKVTPKKNVKEVKAVSSEKKDRPKKKVKESKPEKKDTPKKKKKNVDEPLVNKAVAALLKHHADKSADSKALLGTDAAIQVQIGLEIAPVRPSPKPMRIMIPNPILKVDDKSDDTGLEEPEVCLIVKEESKAWVQEMIAQFPDHMGCIKKVLGLQSLRTKHAQFKQRRELLHKYTIFMADDRILPMLTKALGKDFMKAKKQPIPIALTRKEALPFAILKALSATFMTLSEGTCVNIRAGNTGMPANKLAANIVAITENAIDKLPRKWANVRSIAIKTPESVSLPVYNKTPEELVAIAKMAGLKPVWKEVVKESTSEKEDAESKEKENKRKADKQAAKSPLVRALKKQKQLEEASKDVEEEKVAVKETPKKVESKGSPTRATRSTSKKSREDSTAEAAEEQPAKKAKKEQVQVEPDASAKQDKKRRKSSEVVEKKVEKEVKKVEKSPAKESKKEVKKVEKEAKKVEKSPAKESKKSPAKVEKEAKKVEKSPAKESTKKSGSEAFIESKKYSGQRKGYVFRAGSNGVGYYKDVKPVVNKMAMEAISRMQGRPSQKGNKGSKGGKSRGRR